MKKLIILAAVALVAVCSQAAMFKWTGANIYGSDTKTKFDGTATIMAYTTDLSAAVKVVDVFVVGGTIKSDAVGTSTGFTYNWTDATVGTTYNFYMMFEDGGQTFNSSSSNPSVIKQGTAAVSQTAIVLFANMASSTQNAENWKSVPEPTSGLLLVLGMAGLALRRRRA